MSSGPDWTNRTKRLAALTPGLDIFSQSFVLRTNAGWQITEAGRALLASIETPVPATADNQQPPTVATPAPISASPPIRLVAANRRGRRRRTRGLMRHPAAA
jgi:hypothetical protein